jgi:hypothetical protein
MSEKKMVKISDLFQKPEQIEVNPGQFLEVQGIPLSDIVAMLWSNQEAFLSIYASGQQEKPNYAMMLISAPHMVAQVIAAGADAKGQEEDIERLPAAVQLIALATIWKMTAPDPKKLQECLSTVLAELRTLLKPKANAVDPELLSKPEPSSSPT